MCHLGSPVFTYWNACYIKYTLISPFLLHEIDCDMRLTLWIMCIGKLCNLWISFFIFCQLILPTSVLGFDQHGCAFKPRLWASHLFWVLGHTCPSVPLGCSTQAGRTQFLCKNLLSLYCVSWFLVIPFTKIIIRKLESF
jgi:hypothetical protein